MNRGAEKPLWGKALLLAQLRPGMVASLQVRVVKAGGPSSHLSVGSNKEQKYMGLLTRAAVPPWNGGVPPQAPKKQSLEFLCSTLTATIKFTPIPVLQLANRLVD